MPVIVNTKLGQHRGKQRIWLEGEKLRRAGIEPGMRFNVQIRDTQLMLRFCENGQMRVSRRERNSRISPIIDVMSDQLAAIFRNAVTLRVTISKSCITVTTHQLHQRMQRRFSQLLNKLLDNKPLSVCSLFHGGGVLDRAIHTGLARAGIKSEVVVGVEVEDSYIESSLVNNKRLWADNACVLVSPIEQVALDRRPPEVDLLIAGIPCTGASKAGRAKNKLAHAESHETAGAMFFHFLQFVLATNPSLVLIENLPEYQGTASMQVIRSVLETQGYVLQERVFDGNEFGALERRKRLCVLAISQGLEQTFNLESIVATGEKRQQQLKDVLEPIALDSDRWRPFEHLKEKEIRDKAAGKNFSRQLLTGEETFCGTIGRGYSKCRSTEPFIIHPERSDLSRILTPIEHARVKGIPVDIIDGLSDTTAHEILGQSVIFPVFESIAIHIGKALTKAAPILKRSLSCIRTNALTGTGPGAPSEYMAHQPALFS